MNPETKKIVLGYYDDIIHAFKSELNDFPEDYPEDSAQREIIQATIFMLCYKRLSFEKL